MRAKRLMTKEEEVVSLVKTSITAEGQTNLLSPAHCNTFLQSHIGRNVPVASYEVGKWMPKKHRRCWTHVSYSITWWRKPSHTTRPVTPSSFENMSNCNDQYFILWSQPRVWYRRKSCVGSFCDDKELRTLDPAVSDYKCMILNLHDIILVCWFFICQCYRDSVPLRRLLWCEWLMYELWEVGSITKLALNFNLDRFNSDMK